MNTYMSVTLTNFGMNGATERYGFVYLYVRSCNLTVSHRVSWKAGLEEMAKLAKRLNKAPVLESNCFNPSISSRVLKGFID